MAEVSIYCQQRRDGGMRFGVAVDKATLLHFFRPASLEPDPALDWWIDIVVVSSSLPSHPDSLREWLLANIGALKKAIEATAQKLASGVDTGMEPFQSEYKSGPDLSFQMYVSAVRALAGRQIAERLRDFAAELDSVVNQMESMVAA